MTHRASIRFAPFRCLALAGALLLALPSLPALAQPPGAVAYGLDLDDGMQLVIGGEVVEDAEIYRTQTPPAFMVMSPKLPAPILLKPRGGTVETLDIMRLARRPNGMWDVLQGATLKPQGRFRLDGGDVLFTVEDRSMKLVPKPPLLGAQEAADLKDYSSVYVHRAERYQPDPAAVSALREQDEPVEVKVYFGSWCPHCQRTVPNVVRLAEELEGSNVSFWFYGLPQGFGNEPEAKKHDVTAVPTAIVFVGGREVGRLKAESWVRPEREIRELVQGAS